MNWDNVLMLLGAIGGLEGIKYFVSYLTNRQNNKRINNAEADRAEADANAQEWDLYEKRLSELHKSMEVLNTQLTTCLTASAKKDELIDDKTTKIRELNDVIYGLQNERIKDERIIAVLLQERDFYKTWHCQREQVDTPDGCLRRQPQQKMHIRYTPLEIAQ